MKNPPSRSCSASIPEVDADVRLEAGELVIRIKVAAPADGDALVVIDAPSLAALGLEYRAVRALVDAGTLKTVAIGRKRFTTKSRLLALVDELPAATRERAAKPANDTPKSELELAVARSATRRARRSA